MASSTMTSHDYRSLISEKQKELDELKEACEKAAKEEGEAEDHYYLDKGGFIVSDTCKGGEQCQHSVQFEDGSTEEMLKYKIELLHRLHDMAVPEHFIDEDCLE